MNGTQPSPSFLVVPERTQTGRRLTERECREVERVSRLYGRVLAQLGWSGLIQHPLAASKRDDH